MNAIIYKLTIKVIISTYILNMQAKYPVHITNDTIIVSMTSWPQRITLVAPALYSIYNHTLPQNAIHLVLVLAIPEFPHKELDLPIVLQKMIQAGIVELIWCDENWFSHKKLMPTLFKYPNNPILCCDDDVIRPHGWLECFYKDHLRFPHDVIAGTCCYQIGFDNDIFNPTKCVITNTADYAGTIMNCSRPANGFGGILYPANTFTDSRFFDTNLMMNLSARSDECWQFCFNIIEHRTIRWLSKPYPYSMLVQPNSQKTSMGQARVDGRITSYNEIHDMLFNSIPEFKPALIKWLNSR